MQHPISENSVSPAGIPALRRWAALLLGAAVLLPWGVSLLLSGPGAGRWLGGAVVVLGAYLVAGAFAPRLLRAAGPAVPFPVFIAVTGAALQLVEGDYAWAVVYLLIAIGMLVYAQVLRRRQASE